MCNLETWYVVDEEGEYGVGRSRDVAEMNYQDNVQEEIPANCRVFKLTVRVPVPRPIVATLTVRDDSTVGVVTVQTVDVVQ